MADAPVVLYPGKDSPVPLNTRSFRLPELAGVLQRTEKSIALVGKVNHLLGRITLRLITLPTEPSSFFLKYLSLNMEYNLILLFTFASTNR